MVDPVVMISVRSCPFALQGNGKNRCDNEMTDMLIDFKRIGHQSITSHDSSPHPLWIGLEINWPNESHSSFGLNRMKIDLEASHYSMAFNNRIN